MIEGRGWVSDILKESQRRTTSVDDVAFSVILVPSVNVVTDLLTYLLFTY